MTATRRPSEESARGSGSRPSQGVRMRPTRRSLRSGASAPRTASATRGSFVRKVLLLKMRPKYGGRGASSASSTRTARTASISGGTTDSSRRSLAGTPSQSASGTSDRATSHQRNRWTARPQAAGMRTDYQRAGCPGLNCATCPSTPWPSAPALRAARLGHQPVGRLLERLAVQLEGAPVHRHQQGGPEVLEGLHGLLGAQVVGMVVSEIAVATDRKGGDVERPEAPADLRQACMVAG